MTKQGQIWLVDFDPVLGKKQSGLRPAVVVSGNIMNGSFPLSIVCPLTTSRKNFSGNVNLEPSNQNGLRKSSQVLVFHVKSISHKRFVKKIGFIDDEVLNTITININKLMRY